MRRRTRHNMRLTRRRLVGLILAGLLLAAGAGGWWLFGDLPNVDAATVRGPFQSSRILDRTGRLLYDLVDPHAGQRTVLPLAAMPQALRDATISTEDNAFYSHPGLDGWGLARALWLDLRGAGTGGGSTLTQQVARALLLSPGEAGERSLRRKAREAVLAYQLESRYRKDEILALYLNTVYYGNMAYGVEAAAQAYFGKPARDLDPAECALLAGLPQAPSSYNPLVNPDAAATRTRAVLDGMVRHGYLTEAQANTAAGEPLHFAKGRFPILAPHFSIWVRDQLETRFGADRVYKGGLTVETTLDAAMQSAAEGILRRRLADLAAKHITNGAIVVLDAATGEVRTMVGSADYFDAAIDGEVNLALAPRQPGSAIKPLTYAVALAGDYTAATVLPDVPASYPDGNGQTYVPANYDHQFHGPQRLRAALANSYNVPAVYTLNHIGVYGLVQVGRAAGLTTWDDSRRFGLALTLGGGEVRLLDLTGAFTAFANAGRVLHPLAIRRVTDSGNAVLYDAATDPALITPTAPLFGPHSAEVAWLMGSILSDNDARLPEFGANSPLHLSRWAAVKTGTTGDWRDNWTVGYTPDYVTGVWVGNSDNSPMQNSTGVTGAAPIWHDVMETIHSSRPDRSPARPPSIEAVEICAPSGLLPSPACHERVREWFIAGTAPTAGDTWLQDVAVDNNSGLLACPGAAPASYTLRNFLLLPAEYAPWTATTGLPTPPTGFAGACSVGAAGTPAAPGVDLAFTTPAANAVVGGSIPIQGRAGGPGLAAWTLAWGEGATPQAWHTLAGGAGAAGRSLGQWDTASRGGVHTLRLTARLRDGGALEVRNRVNLDNVPPTAWITYPAPGSDLHDLAAGEQFPLQAEALDNSGVAAVLFLRDGIVLGRRDSPPWTLMVPAAALSPGPHRLTVTAVDLAGNQSAPAVVDVLR